MFYIPLTLVQRSNKKRLLDKESCGFKDVQ